MGDGAVVSAKFSPPNMAPAPRPTKILKLRTALWELGCATRDDGFNGGGFMVMFIPLVESKQSPTKKQIQGPSVWDSFDFQIVRNFKRKNHKTRTLSHIHTLGIYSFTCQQRPVTMLAMLQWSFPHSLGDLGSESLGKDLVDISSEHHAGSRRGG